MTLKSKNRVSHRASGTKVPEALAGGLDFVGGYDPGAEHTRFLGAALLLQGREMSAGIGRA
jgi:hypothetical protein